MYAHLNLCTAMLDGGAHRNVFSFLIALNSVVTLYWSSVTFQYDEVWLLITEIVYVQTFYQYDFVGILFNWTLWGII